jgi:hypothetical protein
MESAFGKPVYLQLMISGLKAGETGKEGHGGRRTARKRMLMEREQEYLLAHF